MKKLFLAGIAALFLATGTAHAHACAFPCNDEQRERAWGDIWKQKPDMPKGDFEPGPDWVPPVKPARVLEMPLEVLRQKDLLPPEEFDRAFTGRLFATRVNADKLKDVCPSTTKDGCSYRIGTQICTMYIVNDDVLHSHGYNYNLVYRHERAHCNGWRHTKNGGE